MHCTKKRYKQKLIDLKGESKWHIKYVLCGGCFQVHLKANGFFFFNGNPYCLLHNLIRSTEINNCDRNHFLHCRA